MYCKVCGIVDEHYEENADSCHEASEKHVCNVILLNYARNKKYFSSNRDGVFVICNAKSDKDEDNKIQTVDNCDHHKIRLYVKPKQLVTFSFNIKNDMRNEDIIIVGIHLAHPQPQFELQDNLYKFGQDPHLLEKKSSIPEDVIVSFKGADIGQYEMPIMFTFMKPKDNKNVIIIREMVVYVQENPIVHLDTKNPYCNEEWDKVANVISSTREPLENRFKVPKLLKIILAKGVEDNCLDGFKGPSHLLDKLRLVHQSTRAILDEGITKSNYMVYFHHLLWWEEVVQRANLRRYNMSGVKLEKYTKCIRDVESTVYVLEVPGLAEKRPSLLRGDRVYIRPQVNTDLVFETRIKDIDESRIHIADIDDRFHRLFHPEALFDVRYLMSRVPMERRHDAIHKLGAHRLHARVFPEANSKHVQRTPITKFYNPLIGANPQQRCAVEHIAWGTAGRAPYIVFGPPGTGKTMTIVEAIVQLVVKNPKNRILVCTESNMAADHIAVMLLRYKKQLKINNFLLRANSQSREWSVMPAELAPVSNGTSFENWYSVNNHYASQYRVVVTTLIHSAKYAIERKDDTTLKITHLFIDEAAQASEPSALVPITGLLAPSGAIVLAGDPRQLGPVCLARDAAHRGLGISLMERLHNTFTDLYDDNPDYITMLVKNFRSHPDILDIPNQLFYNGQLEPCAGPDPISSVSVLGLEGGDRAIVFHGVNSREQRMGNAPSYFNERELDLLKRYVLALLLVHKVEQKDIGIISPYIRQVYKMKSWLVAQQYSELEIGTVEAFQGKEKRVLLVTTVRANCRLLDHDARYNLGFLVDDKRYNVTLTRAKAKLIIIGNPACLTRDIKWRLFMERCEELRTYHGHQHLQLARSRDLLREVARDRMERCRLAGEMQLMKEEKEKGKK